MVFPQAAVRCVLLAAIACGAHHAARAQDVPGCGTLVNAYGPYDYTNPVDVRDKLPIVETFHFDRGVDALRGHAQSGANNLGGDLDYTLRAFPNHHRALDALGRYQLRTKQAPPPGARFTAECYFERALTFAPGDGVAMMVYGIYLARKGDTDAALARYEEALALMPDSSELHYNLGLLYANLGRHDEALAEAHAAYGRGYPLLGLRNKLVRAGAWRDPPPAAPAEVATPADATPPPAADSDAGVAPDAGEAAAPDTQEQER